MRPRSRTQASASAPACSCVPGRRGAAAPRLPRPAHQAVAADVLDEVLERPAAVALGVLDLGADLGERLALPGHLERREVPAGVAGHLPGIEVRRPVAYRAAHRLGCRSRPRRAPPAAGAAAPGRPVAAGPRPDGSWCSAGWSEPCRARRRAPPTARPRVPGRHQAFRRRQLRRLTARGRRQQTSPPSDPPARSSFLTLGPSLSSRRPTRPDSAQISARIGEDRVPDRLMVLDVAGAAAEVAVERLERSSPRDRRAPTGVRASRSSST